MQPTLRPRVSGRIILISQWCWHTKRKMNLPKGTQLVNGKTDSNPGLPFSKCQAWSFSLCHFLPRSVLSVALSVKSYLVTSLWTWAKRTSLEVYQGLLGSVGVLGTGLGKRSLPKCSDETPGHHVQSLCPSGQDFKSKEEISNRTGVGPEPLP